jgi:hypothetical protein
MIGQRAQAFATAEDGHIRDGATESLFNGTLHTRDARLEG